MDKEQIVNHIKELQREYYRGSVTYNALRSVEVYLSVNLDSLESDNIKDRSDKITLLESYSNFLMDHGYLDTDWQDEPPYAIDEFLKESEDNKEEPC